MENIEHAFFQITAFHDREKNRGKHTSAQYTIEKMIGSLTILTYILRETLNAMEINWSQGKTGKICYKNEPIYLDVIKKYYEETIKLTGGPAEGTSFEL